MIKKILRAIKLSRIWIKALDATASENYRTAEVLLDQAISIYAKNPEYHLLRGVVNFRMNAFTESLSDIAKSRDLLRSSKRYSNSEKNYLSCFADKLVTEIIKISPEYSSLAVLEGDFDSLGQGKVREGIRLNFPLKIREFKGS